MALLFIDGFDHYGNNAIVATRKWTQSGSGGVNGPVAGLTGSAMQFYGGHPSSGFGIIKLMPTPGDVFFLGFAVRWSGSGPPQREFIWFREGSVEHITIGITTGSLLYVKRGATVLATATTHALLFDAWYYIEVKIVIHDTTGSVEVRIDGVTVTFNASLTNIDTREGGTGIVDNFALSGGFGGGGDPYITVDDLYLCDDAGGAPRNTFLGVVKAESLMPQTGNGTNVGLTPSTGTDHGALVDEVPPNTTDYNSSPTVGAKDTYNYPSMTLTGTVLGIQTNLYAAKSEVGLRQVCPVIRTGGADTDGVTVSPLTTFGYFSQVWEQKPGATEWTIADVNALEVGMKVTA